MGKVTNEQFLIQVKADIQQALGEMKKLSGEVKDTGKAGEKADKKMSAMSGTIGTLVTATGAYLALGMATKLIKQADAWNQLQARIKTATRETGDYNQVSSELFRITQANGQRLETTVALFQNLARTAPELNATNSEMLELTNTVQQLGVISGTTQAQQRAGLLQFTQGLAGGVFRAEEFNSIIENLPELANRIARGMGLTVGQLRAAVLEGRVLSEDVFQAIQSQTDEIDEQFQEMPQTMERAGIKLDASWQKFLGTLDEAVGTTQGLAFIMDGIAESLDKISESRPAPEPITTEDVQQRVKFLKEEIELLTQRNKELSDVPAQERSFQQQQELNNLVRELSILKKELAGLDDDAITAVENQNKLIFDRSEQLTKAYAEYRQMLAEQWSSSDEAGWLQDQAKEAEAFSKSLADLTAELDPVGAATDDLQQKLELLNQAFFDKGEISGERYDQLVAALLGAADAADQATAELDAMDRALDLVIAQFNELDEAEARQIAGLENIGKTGRESFDSMTAAIRGWGNDFTNTLVEMTTSGKLSFKDLADSIIRDLLRIAIQTQITQPLINSIFPGTFPTKHSGGVVGAGGSTTTVHPAVFALAPRYHSGGIAGLKPNEVPTILERGEEVLTRDDPRHIANRMAGGGTVRVEVHNQNTPIEATSTDVSFDGDSMVVSVFTRDIKSGGPIDSMLRNTYKLGR